MKRFMILAAVAAFVMNANAQSAFKKDKVFDNSSLSIQGGLYQPLYGGDILNDFRPALRASFNKYFNTVMGVSLYGETYINNNNGNFESATTCVPFGKGFNETFDWFNVGANALVNLSNLFCGYNGQPRVFEIAAEAGIGWAHMNGHPNGYGDDVNSFATTNLALDFNFNVAKDWQINLRPGLQYQEPEHFWRFDIRQAVMQVTAGVTYKFGNDFTYCDKLYTQSDLDALNNKINGLRSDLDAAKRDASNWKNKYEAEANKPAPVAPAAPAPAPIINIENNKLAPVVIFDQGKSIINKTQQPSVQMIATFLKNHPDSKVIIKGYASPEGKAELNQRLSEKRAEAVRNMLINTYNISANRLKSEGLGATSEIFPELDWNRVVIFLEDK
ncbi:MAG: OmpA family protein [Bacteroidaceae bacterium]|nr:OmpA family protein [Bacteroidaceae bacterium]